MAESGNTVKDASEERAIDVAEDNPSAAIPTQAEGAQGLASEEQQEKTDKNNELQKKDDDTKGDKDGGKYVKLRVVGNVGSGHDSQGIYFRMKWGTALMKLKRSYSNQVGIPPGSLRFLLDGRRIADDDTPQKLDMSDGDQIDVYHEQTGGIFVSDWQE